MKTIWMVMVSTLMATTLFASGGGVTPPAVEKLLCSDRIRNVIAVDDAYDQNFFAATFGLEPYEYSTTPSTPRGIEALLIRFKV